MLRSLVGSEMCIRDRTTDGLIPWAGYVGNHIGAAAFESMDSSAQIWKNLHRGGELLERERFCQGSRQGSLRDRQGSRRRKTKEAAAEKQLTAAGAEVRSTARSTARSSRCSVDRPGRPTCTMCTRMELGRPPGRPTESTQLSVGRPVDRPVDRWKGL